MPKEELLKTEKERIEDFRYYAGDLFTMEQLERLKAAGYFINPASIHHHGQREGDLYMHSKFVAMLLEEFTKKLSLHWTRPEAPKIIGLLHDYCKADEYIKNEKGFGYNEKVLLKGHGDKSAIMALQMMELTDEEVMCIRYHMGAYEGTEAWGNLEVAIKRYPNILWTMQADMLVSQIMDI